MSLFFRSVILSALLVALQAQAAPVTYTFDALIFGSSYDGQTATGSFSFDDSSLITGDESLTIADGLQVTLNFDGYTFNEFNDVDAPEFPALEFAGFVPVFLDFIIVDGSSGVSFNDWSLFGLSITLDDLSAGSNGFDFSTELHVSSSVPLPASAWLFATALLGTLGCARTRLRTQ